MRRDEELDDIDNQVEDMIADLDEEKKMMIEVLNDHIERAENGDSSEKTKNDVAGLDDYISEIDGFLIEINKLRDTFRVLFNEWEGEAPDFVKKCRLLRR